MKTTRERFLCLLFVGVFVVCAVPAIFICAGLLVRLLPPELSMVALAMLVIGWPCKKLADYYHHVDYRNHPEHHR